MAKRMASPTIKSPISAAWRRPPASMSSAWHTRQDATASGARAMASSIVRPPHGRRAAPASSGVLVRASATSSNTRALRRFLGHRSLLRMADRSCSMASCIGSRME